MDKYGHIKHLTSILGLYARNALWVCVLICVGVCVSVLMHVHICAHGCQRKMLGILVYQSLSLFLWDMISPQNISWPGSHQALVILYPYSTGNLGMNRDPCFFLISWGPGGLNLVLKHYYSSSHCLDLESNTLRINVFTSTVIDFHFPLMKKMLTEKSFWFTDMAIKLNC